MERIIKNILHVYIRILLYVHKIYQLKIYQIALMTSPRNMLWHVVTCRGMSLKKSLITINLIKPLMLAKLRTSHFCCIKLH